LMVSNFTPPSLVARQFTKSDTVKKKWKPANIYLKVALLNKA
jgi:hypothetical protein